MGNFKPNHTCANLNCPYGVDGRPKEYFACDACDRNHGISWRAIACSPYCYQQIMESTTMSGIKPRRLDKTDDELSEIMTMSESEVEASTLQQLGCYADSVKSIGLDKVLDLINEEINNK